MAGPLILQSILIGSLIYFYFNYLKTGKFYTLTHLDDLLQPIDITRHKTEEGREKSGIEHDLISEGSTHWFEIANELIKKKDQDYKNIPGLDSFDGYYVGDDRFFEPVNYHV